MSTSDSSSFGKKLFRLRPDDVRAMNSGPACVPCSCFDQYGRRKFEEVLLHPEVQNTDCEAWKILEILVEKAAVGSASEFSPGLRMRQELWTQIITLPSSIAQLTSVKRLYLYG